MSRIIIFCMTLLNVSFIQSFILLSSLELNERKVYYVFFFSVKNRHYSHKRNIMLDTFEIDRKCAFTRKFNSTYEIVNIKEKKLLLYYHHHKNKELEKEVIKIYALGPMLLTLPHCE